MAKLACTSCPTFKKFVSKLGVGMFYMFWSNAFVVDMFYMIKIY